MKRLTWITPAIALACLASACESSEVDKTGGGGGWTFTTGLPGDKPIGSLSDGEAAALCIDQAKYLSQPALRADQCRFAAVLGAGLNATLSGDMSDAALRKACSDAYHECMNEAAEPAACGDATAPPNCTATVSELGACLEDTIAQFHDLASLFPDCNSLTAADIAPGDGGQTSPQLGPPASCRNFRTKCSGISDAAKSFSDQYCELIAPCCSADGLGSDCNLNVEDAAREGSFDESAGAACLAALRRLQTSADFCSALGHGKRSWDVIADCAFVFAPEPEPGGPPATTWDLPVTGTPGAPCAGTLLNDIDSSGQSSWIFGNAGELSGYLCDHAQGLFCDYQTRVCVPGHALGEHCESPEMCDSRSAFCDVSANTCRARIPAGASCTGSLIGECEARSYCDDASSKCVAAGGTGAACSIGIEPSTLPPCFSGLCDNGTCTSPLAPVCGK